jgi:hypothetical protein
MAEHAAEILNAVLEIRDLIRLMAEPAVAECDRKLRDELRRIVGRSPVKAMSALLMDGGRTQTDIHQEGGMNKGNLSTFIKELKASKLLAADERKPKLAISIPSNFFEAGVTNE